MTLGAVKIDQVVSFTYLGSIISKDGGNIQEVQNRTLMVRDVSSKLKNVWRNRKISLRTKIRILVMTVVKYGPEARRSKNGWRLARCFPKKMPADYLGYLTN